MTKIYLKIEAMCTYQKMCGWFIWGLVLLTSPYFVSAQQIEKLYPFANFTKIKASGYVKIHLMQSDHFEIKLSDEQSSKHLQIEQDGLSLNINTAMARAKNIEVYITMPQLEAIVLDRFSEMTLTPFILQKPLYIDLNGFSKLITSDTLMGPQITAVLSKQSLLKANMQCDEINIRSGMVSNIDLNALANQFILHTSGACRATIQLSCKNSTIESNSSSYVELDMIAAHVTVKTSGAAKVKGKGQWGQQDLTATGASQIDFREARCATSSMESSGVSRILVSGTKTQHIKTSGSSKIIIDQSSNKIQSNSNITLLEPVEGTVEREKSVLEQVSLFQNLLKQLERSNRDATIKIGNKTVLIRDSKISTLENTDGSVSIFVNGVEEERYTN